MTIHDSSNSVVPSGGDRKRRPGIDRPSGLILLLLSCVVLLSLLPLAWWFSIASQDTAGLRSPTSLGEVWLPRGFFLVENFKEALDYIDLRRVVTNSIVVCTAITVVEVFLSTLAGYAFAHLNFRGRRHLYAVDCPDAIGSTARSHNPSVSNRGRSRASGYISGVDSAVSGDAVWRLYDDATTQRSSTLAARRRPYRWRE